MTKPLMQIDGKVREMTDSEYLKWQNDTSDVTPVVTKEQLLAEIQALLVKIEAMP